MRAGDEVGRVSIRVVPNTDGFRRELSAAVDEAEAGEKVTIPVEFDVDTAGLRSQLEALDQSKITIPADIDLDTASFRTRLEALSNSRISIPVDLDLRDEARINAVLARLNNRSIKINTRLNGVSQAIAKLTALDAIIKRLDGRKINIKVDVDAAAAVAHLAAIEASMGGIRETLGGLGSAGGGAGGLGKMFGEGAQGALRFAGILLLIPPIAAGIAAAGAAITAAWGGISTAIVGIPSAIALLAAPIAAVMTGMDGIKAAAKTIKPEFDKMQAAVSATFQKGLTPVFRELVGIFPQLTLGMQGTATALVGIAQRLAEMVTSEAGVARINAAFVNINSTLAAMSPGIAAIVDSFLILASQRSVFDVLSSAVNNFGLKFRDMVLQVSSTTLPAAMEGLKGTINSLTDGLIDLVHNGIDLFSRAAPGLNRALDSITGFFDRFDWRALGDSVSGVFNGLADAINNVPQGTITGIQESFAKLSDVFNSPGFKQGVTDLIGALPSAISLVGDLSREFGTLASDIAPLITGLSNLSTKVGEFSQASTTFAEDLGKKLGVGKGSGFSEFLNGINDGINEALGLLPPKAEELGSKTTEGFDAGLRGNRGGGGSFGGSVKEEVGKVPPAIQDGLKPSGDAVTQGLTPAAQAMVAILSQLPPQVQDQFSQLGGVAQAGMASVTLGIAAETAQWQVAVMSGMTAMQTTVTAGMVTLTTAMTTGFTLVSAAATTGMNLATIAIATGTAQWQVAIATGMTAITTTITAQAVNWNTAISTAMIAMQTTITTGFATTITAAITTGMGLGTIAIATGTADWQVAISTGMTAISTTITTGFSTTIAAAVTTGMAAVTLAIATGTAQWQVAVSTGMVALQLTMDTGFALLVTSATAGTALIQAAITTGFAAIGATVSLAMATLTNIVVVGFAAMKTEVANGLIAVQGQFTTGWATIGTGLQTAIDTCVQTVTTGMSQMQEQTRAGMTNIQNAVRTGMAASAAEVSSGVRTMVNTLTAAIGQFRTAGANMGQALADGLNSKAGAVEGAARRLADAAAAATRAAAGIHSPSKVFIELGEQLGAGLSVGMRNAEGEVTRSARSLTNTIVDQVSTINDAFTGDAWAADLNARMNAELAQHDVTATGSTPDKAVVIQTTINNPLPERGSDSVAKVQRRQAAMGLFG